MTEVKRYVFVEREKALKVAESTGVGIETEEAILRGYQTYIIEQWVCNRNIASNTVQVFTGDENHTIKVCVMSISPVLLQKPSPELKALLDTTMPQKTKLVWAEDKGTDLGEIKLTDPSELPYDMDMVLIPDGDYDKWIKQAYVNINLRRTNCTGRSALNLSKPNPASEEKFRSLYKIADTVDFEEAIIKLVKVVQVALHLFNLLRRSYIDGLICNETTSAFWEFYTKYNMLKLPELKEPWMEPHLMTALISKLVVCRNKLNAYNFTNVKDPFADYEQFSSDIGDYQRAKGLRQIKLLDLETLEKLNEHKDGQSKMRNVIKSKLDDISGISNSPIFQETSDPEVFRDHATIESLRVIWRPRLRNFSSNDSDKPQHEFIHIIKGVSARTTRTSGAAAEMISSFARSLPWVDSRHHQQNTLRSSAMPRPGPIPVASSASQPDRLQSSSPVLDMNSQMNTSSQGSCTDGIFYNMVPHLRSPSSEDEIDGNRSDTNALLTEPVQDPATVIQYTTSDGSVPKGSPTVMRPQTPLDDVLDSGDYVNSTRPHRLPRHQRALSDSCLISPCPKKQRNRNIVRRVQSFSHIPSKGGEGNAGKAAQRPTVTMSIQTYLAYNTLQQQHHALQENYKMLQRLSRQFEERAAQLRLTYSHRRSEFEQIERTARLALDEQKDTEDRLKAVEDNSAKLHYELNVLNDNLKDVEENVSTFYGKIGALEQKMHDSQQSFTTIIIIFNYFNYYWMKIKHWTGWRSN